MSLPPYESIDGRTASRGKIAGGVALLTAGVLAGVAAISGVSPTSSVRTKGRSHSKTRPSSFFFHFVFYIKILLLAT